MPETRYARNGPIHLAYQVLGSGPPDVLVVNLTVGSSAKSRQILP
jgi:hypothetical protein